VREQGFLVQILACRPQGNIQGLYGHIPKAPFISKEHKQAFKCQEEQAHNKSLNTSNIRLRVNDKMTVKYVHTSGFYLDKFTSPVILLLSITFLIITDYTLSFFLALPFMTSMSEAFAFSFRLFCICGGILTLKYIWNEGRKVLNLYIRNNGLRSSMFIRFAKTVNHPFRHIIAAVLTNIAYYIIIFGYV